MVTSELFFQLGAELYPILNNGNSVNLKKRRFITFFGASNEIIFNLWNLMCDNISDVRNPMYLMWTMMFIKQYNKESTYASICGCTEKTFRKWVWIYLKVISRLDLVSLFK